MYSDETGIDDNEVISTGWAPKGQRCFAQKKAKCSVRYNIIAALNPLNELFAPLLFEGYCNAEIYATYLEQVLIPVLKPGQILIIDNASFHKSKKITALIEQAQCKIFFLPPYSPDFNPIEHFWSSIKHKIRTLFSFIHDFYDAAVQILSTTCSS